MPAISLSSFIRNMGLALVCTTATAAFADSTISEQLDKALDGDHRSAENKARDQYRHPHQTLTFFGLEPDMRVLEITPGGGWYTEVLAPVLQERGELIAASFGADHPVDYLARVHGRYMDKLDADPDTYGAVERILFQEDGRYLPALADESVDMVVTFRNTHNWIKQGEAEAIYQAMHRVLKPCGTLGVVQHRAADDADVRASAKQGYVPEPYMVDMLEGIGFELVARSDINANPKDDRDHPEGVWTLPPSYRLGDTDRDKYEAIGESDRMTLKLRKPGAQCPAS
ncbi:putative methyltransferase [Methylohalomonas lacus]|uniref:Methyltransferase n=1 Tax=Methylohalomonas lacus TaxID=398773 RepID=A0AAE3HIA0_9GAMM|nr:methyltransferase domain-containing protein [Methylohalomonas lacus]MCS3902856.1 putative methyltransferase [Methylohalomonas lacus]